MGMRGALSSARRPSAVYQRAQSEYPSPARQGSVPAFSMRTGTWYSVFGRMVVGTLAFKYLACHCRLPLNAIVATRVSSA